MKHVRENGMYHFAECDNCGNELKVMRAHCKKETYGYLVNRPVKCQCGESSSNIMLPKVEPVEEEQIKCPICRSTQISAGNKGFGLGKAAVGGLILGPVGLLGGLFGSKAVVVSCLKCGNRWEAGSI